MVRIKLPLPCVLAAIRASETTFSALLIMHKFTLASAAVGPRESAPAMRPAICPLALARAIVGPPAGAAPPPLSMAITKLAKMHATIGPLKAAFAMLLPEDVGAYVLGGVIPLLNSLSVRTPIQELPNVF